MASIGAKLQSQVAVPTLEVYRGAVITCTAVGATAIPLPATNLSHRKGIFIQNLHAAQTAQIGAGLASCVIGNINSKEFENDYTAVAWHKSATGNEWYCTNKAGTASGVGTTTPTFLFYNIKGTDAYGAETVGTKGTVGALAASHNWGWGDGDTLGFNTLYIRSTGATAAYAPNLIYDTVIFYTATVTSGTSTTSTNGFQLKTGESMWMTLDGSARLFAIASGADTPVVTLELI